VLLFYVHDGTICRGAGLTGNYSGRFEEVSKYTLSPRLIFLINKYTTKFYKLLKVTSFFCRMVENRED
jgi:hypothetical protein